MLKRFVFYFLIGISILYPKISLAQSVTCDPMRYSFTDFIKLTYPSFVYFGDSPYNYDAGGVLSWLEQYPVSTYISSSGGSSRFFGFAATSNDCGQTWTKLSENVAPLKIDGNPTNGATSFNGVVHFASRLDGTNFLSQGVVSYINWTTPNYNPRIYAVFQYGPQWSYQALDRNDDPPAPIIGSSDLSYKDNFYSPSIVPTGDSKGTIQLYFGGWRSTFTPSNGAPLPQCQGWTWDDSSQPAANGFIEKDCTCPSFTAGNEALDACTGDKIFMSTNANAVKTTGNYLDYQIYRPSDGTYSSNSKGSQYFEPVVYPALLNNTCHVTDLNHCPFPLVATNDPTVVTIPGQTRQYMYFTGSTPPLADSQADPFFAFIHSAVSDDGGKTWKNFAILTKTPGVRFPGGLPYSETGGTHRAFGVFKNVNGQKVPRIFIVVVPEPLNNLLPGADHGTGLAPFFNDSENDALALFLYEIDPNQPDTVIRSQKVIYQMNPGDFNTSSYYLSNYTTHLLGTCPQGSNCKAKTVAYSPTFGEIKPTQLIPYKEMISKGYDVNVAIIIASIPYFQNKLNNPFAQSCATQTINEYNNAYSQYGINWPANVETQVINNVNSCKTLFAPPPTPTGLVATAGNGQVVLNWNASAGANTYSVARFNGAQWTWIAYNLTQTTYTDTTVTNGTTYYYIVIATNANGNSPNSAMVSALPMIPVPAAPANLLATSGNGQVVLNWNAGANDAYFSVARYANGQWTWIATLLTHTNYTDNNAANGTTYYYVVAALNSAGAVSPNSNMVSATPTAPLPPAAPTGLYAIPGNGQVTLLWNASSGATSYSVARYDGIQWTWPGTYLTQTSYTDTGLNNGATYYYVVIAINSSGNSSSSNQVSATPI